MKRAAALRVLASLALLGACDLTVAPPGPLADLRGTWTYTGTQAASTLQLAGTMLVTRQSGDVISGSLSWEERDGLGGVQVRGGPLSGRVIGVMDADFDVMHDDAARRHVARITADTIEGVWAVVALGQSGEFRAVRGTAP